nr:head-tail connector protein [Bacteriovorax sp. HI3]
MASVLADRLIHRFNSLETGLASHKARLKEIAEYFQPERSMGFGADFTSDDDRAKIFDSTPEDCLENLAAFTHTLLTPSTQMWSYVGMEGVQEEELPAEEKEWLDIVSRKMSDKFNSERLGFHNSVHEFFLDYPSFGTAAFFVDEEDGEPRFECLPIDNIRFSENSKKIVDTVYRTITMTARQIVEKWPEGAGVTLTEVSLKDPERRYKVLHVIEPRKKFKEDAVRGKDMPIASYYIALDTKKTLHESGYHEMPIMVARWSKISGSVWGRGIGQKSLPDVRVLNAMNRSSLIAGEKAADPTTLLPHDGFISPYSSDGGATNYYRASLDMKDKVITIGSDADLNALLAFIDKRQGALRKMWLNDKILEVGGPQKTATEILEATKARMNILGPVGSRVQPEFLGPLVNRVFRIMYRNGEFPEAPESIVNAELKVSYISPITRAQKQVEAEAFQQALTYLAPMVQAQPQMMRNFDFDEIARDTQALFGYPAKYLKDRQKVAKEDQAAAEEAQAQKNMADASNVLTVAGQAKDLNEVKQQAA